MRPTCIRRHQEALQHSLASDFKTSPLVLSVSTRLCCASQGSDCRLVHCNNFYSIWSGYLELARLDDTHGLEIGDVAAQLYSKNQNWLLRHLLESWEECGKGACHHAYHKVKRTVVVVQLGRKSYGATRILGIANTYHMLQLGVRTMHEPAVLYNMPLHNPHSC